ncbi:AAA family ATPase [Gorillibacterium massiliense]|uniref:AAA family ATPase n=1 Tax=Gorillibacterium massiliense TaxID=1280390 RepID=UPI0004B679DA|nr:AAA family ATPase [Gorillibacterium massiliense]
MIELGILSDDEEYLNRFRAYARFGAESHRFALKFYTSSHFLGNSLNQERLDILLADGPLIHAEKVRNHPGIKVALGEDSPVTLSEGIPFVHKYQPIDRILEKLAGLYGESSGRPAKANDASACRIVSVYSAAGGSGKTVAAGNLAKALAYYGSRVMLLQLEATPSLPFTQASSEGQSYERLLFCLKTDPAKIPYRLPQLVHRDPRLNADCLEPVESKQEMEQLKREEAAALLKALAGCGYGYIVVDLDSGLHDRTLGAMDASDLVIWLVTDDINSLHKTSRQHREWTLALDSGGRIDKTVFAANKYTGAFANDTSAFGIVCTTFLPYVPEWKSVTDPGQLLAEPVLQEEAAALIRRYFSD